MHELFGDRLASLDMTRREYVERIDGGPRGYRDFFYRTFGPVIALRQGLADADPDRAAAFDRDSLAFVERCNHGPDGGAAELTYPYLLIVAHPR